MKKLLYCMLMNFSLIVSMQHQDIKVADNEHNEWLLPVDVINESIPLLKQHLQQEGTIVACASSQEVFLFQEAFNYKRSQFKNQFFDTLSSKDQQLLISAAGQKKLCSPYLTALLVEAYFPTDICTKIVHYLKKDRKEIEHYMRCAMMRNNLTKRPILLFEDSNHYKKRFVYHPHGQACVVPKKIKEITDCTANNIWAMMPINAKKTIIAKLEDNDLTEIEVRPDELLCTFLAKKIGDCEYRITWTAPQCPIAGNQNECFLWRISNNSVTCKKIRLQNNITGAQCSADGKYIIIFSSDSQNNLLLVALNDPLQDTIVCERKLIDTQNQAVSVMAFAHTRPYAIVALYDEIHETSQLLFIDVKANRITFGPDRINEKIGSISFNHDDSLVHFTACNRGQNSNRSLMYSLDENLRFKEPIDPHKIKGNLRAMKVNDGNGGYRCIGGDVSCTYKMIGDVEDCYYMRKAWFNPYNTSMAVVPIAMHRLLLLKGDSVQLLQEKKEDVCSDCLNAVLFSTDRKFIFHYSVCEKDENSTGLFVIDMLDSLLSHTFVYLPRLYVWDIQSGNLIAKVIMNAKLQDKPELILSHDKCSLFTNTQNRNWSQHVLYSEDERNSLCKIKQCVNPFDLYALRRLYYMHREKQVLQEGDRMFDWVQSLSIDSPNLRQCIINYLVVKQRSLAENSANHLTSLAKNTLYYLFPGVKNFKNDFFS